MQRRNASKPTKTKALRTSYFRVDAETWRRLSALAEAEGVPVSIVIRRAVRDFLSRLGAAA